MVSSLKLQNGAMIGTLAGKSLVCFVHATKGSGPPDGKYIVRGPIEDPIYGRVAILVSTRAGSVVNAPVYQWIQQPPAGATAFNCFMPSGAAVGYYVLDTPGAPSMDDWTQTPAGGGGAFLLSGRAIPGANCLVVTSGLTELMDALKLAGGAEITIG